MTSLLHRFLLSTSRAILLAKPLAKEALIISLGALLVICAMRLWDRLERRINVPPSTKPSLAVGSSIKIEGIDVSSHPLSLVLISSPGCTYCRASKSFHSKLAKQSAEHEVPLVVVVPSKKDALSYLQDVGFNENFVREWKDISVKVEGTPTLMALDGTGLVRAVWVGVLAPYDEADVLEMVQTHNLGKAMAGSTVNRGARTYSSNELRSLSKVRPVSIVDVHERAFAGIRSAANNIPALELSYRAAFELDRGSLQLVDCANLTPPICDGSVQQLSQLGFDAAALDRGLYHQTCRSTIIH